jgi:hypothetical protein
MAGGGGMGLSLLFVTGTLAVCVSLMGTGVAANGCTADVSTPWNYRVLEMTHHNGIPVAALASRVRFVFMIYPDVPEFWYMPIRQSLPIEIGRPTSRFVSSLPAEMSPSEQSNCDRYECSCDQECGQHGRCKAKA